jgi:hypothetical protein
VNDGAKAVNLVYMNVVAADTDVRLVRYKSEPKRKTTTWRYLSDALRQPLDVVLCPSLSWGCRYLRVDHRTLVDHVWDEKAMADLRRGGAGQVKLATVEGLMLRDRSLRFAVLDGSSLFAADLIGTDLRAASFQNASLLGAKLSKTSLQRAVLSETQLQGADLSEANLTQQTNLFRANLSEVNLMFANLTEANLSAATMTGTHLDGANLSKTKLLGAEGLTQDQLDWACGDSSTEVSPGLTVPGKTAPCHGGLQEFRELSK